MQIEVHTGSPVKPCRPKSMRAYMVLHTVWKCGPLLWHLGMLYFYEFPGGSSSQMEFSLHVSTTPFLWSGSLRGLLQYVEWDNDCFFKVDDISFLIGIYGGN